NPVLVHRPVSLLHASFRPHLTVTPLRFATLPLHQVGTGLSPASCRTCTAYQKREDSLESSPSVVFSRSRRQISAHLGYGHDVAVLAEAAPAAFGMLR